jgi:hypothetical protein
MHLPRLLFACGLCVSVAGCGGIIDPSKNTITPISGTLQPNQPNTGNSHQFRASRNGELLVTLTSVAPSPSTGGSLGVALGQSTNNSCALLPGYISSGIVNRAIQFFQIQKGDYCIFVFDPGVITVQTAYTGNISHP